MGRHAARCWQALLFLAYWASVATSAGGSGTGSVSLTTFNSQVTQGFDSSLGQAGTNLTALPNGWYFWEEGSQGDGQYRAGNGNDTVADTWSFGAGTDRAFGTTTGSNLAPSLGASFTNNLAGGEAIRNVRIQYTLEEWYLAATGREDRLDFQYSTDATSLTTGTWTDVDALDGVTPNTAAPAGKKDGNANVNRRTPSALITGLNIATGGKLWIRWLDFDIPGSDNEDGLAIDNFGITPNVISYVDINPTYFVLQEGQSTTYTLTVDPPAAANVVVTITPSSSYVTTSPSSVTFAPGGPVAQTITLIATENILATGNLTETIQHTVNNRGTMNESVVTVVVDNEVAAFTVTNTGDGRVFAGKRNQTFRVVLTAQPLQPVNITVSQTSPLVATPQRLEFQPAQWNISQTFVVSAASMVGVADGQTVTFPLSSTSSSPPFHNVTRVASVTLYDVPKCCMGLYFEPVSGLCQNCPRDHYQPIRNFTGSSCTRCPAERPVSYQGSYRSVDCHVSNCTSGFYWKRYSGGVQGRSCEGQYCTCVPSQIVPPVGGPKYVFGVCAPCPKAKPDWSAALAQQGLDPCYVSRKTRQRRMVRRKRQRRLERQNKEQEKASEA